MFRSKERQPVTMTRAMAKAVETGDLDTVRKLITRHAGDIGFLNAPDQFGNTALLKAIRYGKIHIAEYLLSIPGVNANQEAWQDKFESGQQYRCAPLNLAIRKGYLGLVKKMLQLPNINVNNYSFMPPLSVLQTAVFYCQREIINLVLCHAGLKFDWLQNMNKNIITWAYYHLSRASFNALITHSNVKIHLGYADTSEYLSSLKITCDLHTTLNLLLAQPDFDINSQLWNGETVLMHAARHGFDDLVRQLLASDQLNVYLQDGHGLTAVLWAAKNGHMNLVKLLLDNPNFKWEMKYQGGKNLLMLAAEHQLEELVGIILERGKLDVNARDDAGDTALILAARCHDNRVIVASLLKHKANIRLANILGSDAYREAKLAGHLHVQALLKSRKINEDEYQRFLAWKMFYPQHYVELLPENLDTKFPGPA